MHGFINGLPDAEISDFVPGVHPKKLIDYGYGNWPAYSKKFGFVSLGKIRDQYSTILYTLKYISKDVEALRSMKGQHLYFASRPLKMAEPVADVYGQYTELDSYLNWHGKFCSTGFVTAKDWTFPLKFEWYTEFLEAADSMEPVQEKENPDFRPEYIDPSLLLNFEQMGIWSD
jgi:hypothetical protein